MSAKGNLLVLVLKRALADFQRHGCQWLAAAISYFTVFAVAPLIIVVVEIAGAFLGQHRSVLAEIYGTLQTAVGKEAADAISEIVTAALSHQRSGVLAQVIGWAVFLFAAMGLFGALQTALNVVWDVEPKKQGVIGFFHNRALSFAMVLGIAFLLLVALGVNTVLTAFAPELDRVFPFFPTLTKAVDFVLSFVAIAALFALLFQFLPDCRIAWRDVWLGAIATSLLFVIGQFLLGWYLARAGISSTYGVFGALVLFMLWVNYSAQIVLLGAEFTHAYALTTKERQGELHQAGKRYRP